MAFHDVEKPQEFVNRVDKHCVGTVLDFRLKPKVINKNLKKLFGWLKTKQFFHRFTKSRFNQSFMSNGLSPNTTDHVLIGLIPHKHVSLALKYNTC